MREERRIRRRDFLKRSGMLGLAALGAPAVGRAMGANGAVGLGIIGCGARGGEHIEALAAATQKGPRRAVAAAVCDVYQPRLDAAAAKAKADAFRDYRDVLRRPDIDGVMIATPDHWHARMAREALEAGKDVYVEPPLALRWEEAQRVAETARRAGRVLQVGATSCAEDKWWRAREAIRQGAIGKLVWSQSCYAANSRVSPWNRPIDKGFSPRKLDWAAFLGPAPRRPLDPERFFRWQKFWDYSGGLVTAELYERLAHLLVAVGPALPLRVCAAGSGRVFPDQETPDNFHAILHYPSDHTVVLMATQACSENVGEIIRGHEATIFLGANDARIAVQRAHRRKHPDEVRLRPRKRPSLLENFIECVRSGGELYCGPDVGFAATVGIDLAIRAFRTGEMVKREA